VLVFVGANPVHCASHPVATVLRNPHRPEIIVLDPRRTETAVNATLHLPLAPKSDLDLLYGIAAALIARGAVDRAFVEAHTEGYEAFAAFGRRISPGAGLCCSGVRAIPSLIDAWTSSPAASA
jgi:assimilatory nitrate reductase catalytic subunit